MILSVDKAMKLFRSMKRKCTVESGKCDVKMELREKISLTDDVETSGNPGYEDVEAK